MFVLIPFFLYFFPVVLAASRKHHSLSGIIVLNILLGWTLFGWVAALVWAMSRASRIVANNRRSVANEIAKLAVLKERRVLTENEFVMKKRMLLRLASV